VIVPVCAAELLAAGADELLEPEAVLDELLLEQPATAIAASATAARAKRRMLTPWLHLHGRDQLSRESQPCPPHDRPTWPGPVWTRRAPPRPQRAAVKAGSFLAETGIITRTLPSIVARRKEFRHHFGDSRDGRPAFASQVVITHRRRR
jgi:hypothetical protein